MREIVKEAMTVALFIDEIEEDIEYSKHDIPHARLQLARRVVNNFLKRMEQRGYKELKEDNWSHTYYEEIQRHLDMKVADFRSTAVYLTYVQMQIHSFMRGGLGYLAEYRRNPHRVSYYKSTLETLMN